MRLAEWDALAAMVLDANRSIAPRNLPGNIRAQKTGEQLTLARLK